MIGAQKKLHPFAVVFCWFSHIWSLESHIAQWVSHCYSSSTCITFQVVPLDVSFQVCFMSMAVWCFSYTWMCGFFWGWSTKGTTRHMWHWPEKTHVDQFWCPLQMMSDLYNLLSWYHAAMSYRWMVNSSLFGFIWFSEVSSFGGEMRGGRKSPEVFLMWKKGVAILRFFFSWWYFIVVFPWLAWWWWSSSCLYSICFHLYDSFALLLLHCMTF